MKIGLLSSQVTDRLNPQVTMQQVVEEAIGAERLGFDSFWIVNSPWGMDAMTVANVAGQKTESIELGTSVVPAFPRHPVIMAQQAITTNIAMDGRFTLGIGVSHKDIMENEYQVGYQQPARRMSEYLQLVVPLCKGEQVNFKGEFFSANIKLRPPGFLPVNVLVAAMGPKMLEVTGAHGHGTLPWLVSAERLEDMIVPTICNAAKAAGRPAPRVSVILPVVVSDNVPEAKQKTDALLDTGPKREVYEKLKEEQGSSTHADVAIIGNKEEIYKQLMHLKAIGISDFIAAPLRIDDTSYHATCQVLSEIRQSLTD